MEKCKKLSKREEDVLRIVVCSHMRSTAPVGSSAVADMLGLSSATIRNVMSNLENEGFITQPHTSAGRIPTDYGYRYYVDSLMTVKSLNSDLADIIEEAYRRELRSLEEVLERTTHFISDFTKYIGVTATPQIDRVYLEGTSHIMEQPEFRDFKKLYGLFKYLDNKANVLHFLCDELDSDTTKISIGRENKLSSLANCSVISRSYKKRGKACGKLGVIGPKRMAYERVVPLVGLLSKMVSEMLDGFNE